MQIHEVTLPTQFVSNLAKKAGSGLVQAGKGAARAIAGTTVARDIAGAVKAPFQKAAAVMGTPGALTDPHAYRDAMQQYRAGQVAALEPQVQAKLAGQIAQKTQQRAKQFAQAWKAHQASGMAGTTGKAPPGGMSAAMAASKTGQTLQNLYGTPKGGIEGMKSDLEEAINPNAEAFRSWAEATLASNIPARSGLTMDVVKKNLEPTEKTTLNSLLARIGNNPDDTGAVEQYFEVAMQAMQRVSQEIKQARPTATSRAGAQGVLDRYLDDTQIQKLQTMAKDPTYASIIKKELGLP